MEKQLLLKVKTQAEQVIEDKTNPPWVVSACRELIAAVQKILDMMEVPTIIAASEMESSQQCEQPLGNVHPQED